MLGRKKKKDAAQFEAVASLVDMLCMILWMAGEIAKDG